MSAWLPAAITAVASLAGGLFGNRAEDERLKAQQDYDREKMIAELELEKFRILNQKGGGGGADRELAMLEAALGISDRYSQSQRGALRAAKDNFTDIYSRVGR
jgi:hypothetical protein